MRHDELHLWFLGDPAKPRLVGSLTLVAAGKGVSLRYARGWLDEGFALSEDTPLVDLDYAPAGRFGADAPRAAGAVDDARPDRWGERVIRFVDRPQRLSLMEYLYYAGDDRFGALGVSTSVREYLPRPAGPLPRLEQAQQLSEVVLKIEAGEPISALEAKIVAGGGSLGGAKPKALIEIAGEQWLIKFFNGEPIDTPLVEHAAMTLAHRAGIHVAQTRPIRLRGGHALAVRRFDRQAGLRIHGISAGTAIRAATASGSEPEQGYPELARILRRRGIARDGQGARDAGELFRRMVFNILIDNTDDHEKNHALLAVEPASASGIRLAPAYDVLPSGSGQGRQEFVCGDDGPDSTLENALSQREAFGLDRQEAVSLAREVSQVVDGWRTHFQQAGVSAADIDELARGIDADPLIAQRRSFAAAPLAVTPPRKPGAYRRRNPFKR